MGEPRAAVYALIIGVWVLVSSVTAAVAEDDPTAAANQALAQERYDAGKRAYDIGAFDEAIVEWKKAYQFYGAPDFLFNIAQAYRQKRDYNEAIFFFNAYLRASPSAPNQAEVEALRDEMVALQKREQEMKSAPPQDVKPLESGSSASTLTPSPATEPAAAKSTAAGPELTDQVALPREDRGASWRLGGMIAGGAGLAFVATGIAFSLSASSTESTLEEASANREPWSAKFEDMEAKGERNATIGTSLMIAGGLGVVAGAAAYVLGTTRRGEQTVAIVPQVEQDAGTTRVGMSVGMSF